MAALGRVRGAATFRELRRQGVRARCGPVTVTWVPAGDGPSALAFAIGRRVGTAVVRNRLRRRLRAVFAELADRADLAPGTYLVSTGPEAATLDYGELRDIVHKAVSQLSEPR